MSVVHIRSRQCVDRLGIAKKAWSSFDEAQDVVNASRKPVHAYKCAKHGWHLGSNFTGWTGEPRS